MTGVVFVGVHGALAAALARGAFVGPEPEEAVAEAIDELAVPFPPRLVAPGLDDVVVDTDVWGLPEPVGLCLEEVRELCAVIERRVSSLPL